jgi:hypothetical protein
MTVAVLIVAALALALSAAALWLAVTARGDARSVGRGLAQHRKAHADRSEERRAARHRTPEAQPQQPQEELPDSLPTEQMAAIDAPTRQAPAVVLPRPGIGSQR